MPMNLRCPECGARVVVPDHQVGRRVWCDQCGTTIETDDFDADRRPRYRRDDDPAPRRKSRTGLVVGLIVGVVVLLLGCCGGVGYYFYSLVKPTKFPEETQTYAEARKGFRTSLVQHGPAPQPWQHEVPPAGATEITYRSGTLNLKAWASDPVGKARGPAVLFLHGGFAFGEDDWEMTEPYRDAGFVVMTPMLRGENGLPGDYTMFYDEVDDVLAAAEALAARPDVDPKRIFVAGHSAGGTLTLLAAMTSDKFRAAASFSGSPDQVAFVRGQEEELAPFDRTNPREFQMRSPLAFPKSFKCPVRVYYGSKEFAFAQSSKKLAELAKAAGKDVEAVSVPGDHFTAVEPAMRQSIAFFKQFGGGGAK